MRFESEVLREQQRMWVNDGGGLVYDKCCVCAGYGRGVCPGGLCHPKSGNCGEYVPIR